MSAVDQRPLNVLVVVATAPEAARLQALPARVVVSGVGAVAAALATAQALRTPGHAPTDLVVCAGIAGVYPSSGLGPGDLAVSSSMIQADLGAEDGERFLSLRDLGLSTVPEGEQYGTFAAWEGAEALARRLEAGYGPALTLGTVTGNHERARQLEARFPGALTEGMEGAGAAHAALLAGVPAVEIRGVSNAVGPRDRGRWRIPQALDATARGLSELLKMSVSRR